MTSGFKRSLFSKPAWAAVPAPAASTQSRDDDSIFGRNNVYQDIVQAKEERRRRRLAKAQLRAKDPNDPDRETKKRRISIEPDDDHDPESDAKSVSSSSSGPPGKLSPDSPKANKKRVSPPPEIIHQPVTRSTPKKEKKLNTGLEDLPRSRHALPSDPMTTSLDAEEEQDELLMLTPPRQKKKPTPVKSRPDPPLSEDESEEESEFVKALKAQAREKARLRQLGLLERERSRTPNDSFTETNNAVGSSRLASAVARTESPASTTEPASTTLRETTVSQPPGDDPEVKLYIKSAIPSTKDLIVKRKTSQSLKQVREYWCKVNSLDPKAASQVFFAWNGTRLFDSTTMRGIIQKLKMDHARKNRSFSQDLVDIYKDPDNQVLQDPSRGQILIEAMTHEIFEQRQRDKEKRARRQEGIETSDDDEAEAEGDHEAAAREEEKLRTSIRIRLVARDLDPLTLNVRPHTSIGKIVQGYGVQMGLDKATTAWLVFDGERLDPESTAEDVGFENEDEIEVHIR